MPVAWTAEKLAALSPTQLENVKRNAIRLGQTELVEQCKQLQGARKAKAPSTSDPVVGFHFVCKSDDEVKFDGDGHFWSGVWKIDERHCAPAMKLGGYVALHESRDTPSYRQGQIVEWKAEPRNKGPGMGITFKLRPMQTAIRWYGNATGEKGYRRASDEPSWTPPPP